MSNPLGEGFKPGDGTIRAHKPEYCPQCRSNIHLFARMQYRVLYRICLCGVSREALET